jgi:hypothetical protein
VHGFAGRGESAQLLLLPVWAELRRLLVERGACRPPTVWDTVIGLTLT